ncbi:hypothetical protein ACFQZQ_01370 [Lysobacter koreensis]|uniref:DUF4386 family protein n=1 Tax=Lysobacter koreensis TaxID=266122 RepID=A0ABW2YHL7_9GAMM
MNITQGTSRMLPQSFFRWTGLALMLAGALTLLISIALTPLVAGADRPFVETAASSAFLWRQSLSALAAALLLFGSVGLYLLQANRAGRFGAVAFAMAFVGSALLLAWEWVDIFILHDLALRAPDALRVLDEQEGLHFYDLGALIPIGLFALGWIALAVSTIRVCRPHRRAAWLLVIGFFAVPMLSAAFGPLWGGALGNAVLCSGWILLGLAVSRGTALDATGGPAGDLAP